MIFILYLDLVILMVNLINFLIKKKTINIHMGISPYYRGSDCNFWAMYDNNLHLVGGTVHLISKGLDFNRNFISRFSK